MKSRRCLLALALLALGAVCAAESDEAAIKKQIEAIKDSDTSGWRKIPWTQSILAARQAAAKENQPIFVFTHDGNIETGRC